MGKKVIVLGEIRDGELRNVTFEAIAAGRTISGDGEVIGVLIGENVQSIAQELIHYGADKVLTAETEAENIHGRRVQPGHERCYRARKS